MNARRRWYLEWAQRRAAALPPCLRAKGEAAVASIDLDAPDHRTWRRGLEHAHTELHLLEAFVATRGMLQHELSTLGAYVRRGDLQLQIATADRVLLIEQLRRELDAEPYVAPRHPELPAGDEDDGRLDMAAE